MESKAQRFFGGGMVNSPSQKAGEAATCAHLDTLEDFFPLLENLDFYPKQEVKMKSLNLAGAGEVGAVGGGGGVRGWGGCLVVVRLARGLVQWSCALGIGGGGAQLWQQCVQQAAAHDPLRAQCCLGAGPVAHKHRSRDHDCNG